jgi:putative Holliday junction resolvase
MRTAAIDFGRKRLGLAITDDQGRDAYPLGAMERRSLKLDLEAIRSRLAERGVTRIVVGLPLNMDGSEGPAARAARAFAERLAAVTGLPVELYDERLSSFEAEERLRGAVSSRAARKRAVDAIAAVVILEGWLQSRARRSPRG